MHTNVVIIGAGPAGLLLAHYLLRRGKYKIDIYEGRSASAFMSGGGVRSFPISLQERGIKAMRVIPGLEEAITAAGIFCQGTVVYKQNGKVRRIGPKHPILTIDRNRLVTILLEQLTQNYTPEQIKIHFDCKCTDVDGTAKTVTLQSQQGDRFAVNYDVLVGADGARSQIRQYLQQKANLQCSQSYIPEAYKSISLNRLNPEVGLELEADQIHASNMGNNTRMLMVPQPGDKLNGVIIFNPENNPLKNLSNKAEVLEFFNQNFPVFAQLMTESSAEAFLNRPVGRVLTVRCDRFHHGDSILIIGDAAHAVSPSIGQGCNSSLEDVFILNRFLEKYEDDWGRALSHFSKHRVPDAYALWELSNYFFARKKSLAVEFLLRMILSRFLHKWFPRWFQPFMFDLIMDTDVPYSQVLQQNLGWVNKVKRSMVGTVATES